MKIMRRNRFAALLAIILILTAGVCGTVAYLVASTDSLVNTFTPSHVNVQVEDVVTNNVKSNVVITNTGDTNAYIRARIVGSWVSNKDDTTVVQKWNPDADGEFDDLPGRNWKLHRGYYYYTKPVAPNQPTGTPLFTSYEVKNTVDGAHLVMDILVQAIQSEGGAAQAAWGVDPSTLN